VKKESRMGKPQGIRSVHPENCSILYILPMPVANKSYPKELLIPKKI
jgi:hypothetical protein